MSIILESLLVEKWRFPGVSFLSEAICTSFLNQQSVGQAWFSPIGSG